MKRYYALAMALALAASAGVASAQAAEPTTKPAMVTTYGVRVRITWAQSGVSFSSKSIIDLLETPWYLYQVPVEEFRKHVVNLEAIEFTPLLSFGRAPSQEGYLLGEYCMGFGKPVKEAVARKALETLVGHLRRLLLAEQKIYAGQIARKRGHAGSAEYDASRMVATLSDGLEGARKRSAQADVAWKLENSRAAASELSAQLRHVNVEGAAKKERLRAVRDQIAKLVREAATQATAREEPAVTKLRELVAAQERELQDLRGKLGPEHRKVKGLQSKLAVLEAQLAKAFVDQEARRDAALKGAGTPELIRKLKAEGIALMIDLREMEARAAALEHKLADSQAKGKKLLAQLSDWQAIKMLMERYEAQLTLARKRYQDARAREAELEEELSALEAPTVTILKPPGRTGTRPKGGK